MPKTPHKIRTLEDILHQKTKNKKSFKGLKKALKECSKLLKLLRNG